MRRRSRAEQSTTYPTLRKLAGMAVVLLAISLPALWAFAAIDAPVRPSESRRVEAALLPGGSDLSEVGRLFYGAALHEADAVGWPKEKAGVMARARLSGMLALFVISGLVYLVLAQVRGRATGVAGSLSLATLTPVAGDGFVLRPEQAATMFGLLGVALLVGLPVYLRSGRRRGVPAVGLVFGFALAVHQPAWIYLAVPALTLLVSVLALAFLLPRATRGRPIAHWPLRAAARRYAPWMWVVLVCSLMSWLVLVQLEGQPERWSPVPEPRAGLLPAQWWWSGPLIGCALLGAARMGYGVSLRLQRLRRVRPETVLFLYVAPLLMQYFLSVGTHDQLPAAVALACLMGDGLMAAVVLLTGRLARR